MRTIAVVALTTLLLGAISAFTRVPWTPPTAGDAVLRFSWRTTVSARERCRARTPQELEALPVHMRTPEVCEPDEADYVLITRIDEERPDTLPLLRGGVKGDRPLFVLEERTLAPGRHRVRVELLRVNGGAEPLAAPLDAMLDLVAGTVRLVTLDPVTRALTVRN